MTFQSISGISKGWEELDLDRLKTYIQVATKGEKPTATILVRKEN